MDEVWMHCAQFAEAVFAGVAVEAFMDERIKDYNKRKILLDKIIFKSQLESFLLLSRVLKHFIFSNTTPIISLGSCQEETK